MWNKILDYKTSFNILRDINDNSCKFLKTMNLLILNPFPTDACPYPRAEINLMITDDDLNLPLTLKRVLKQK